MTTPSPKSLKRTTSQSTQPSSFIRKSYQLLEEQKFPEIVDWNAEGTALVIKQPTEFAQKVLPAYFRHNNLTSFVRQLNMYDFRKRKNMEYCHVYYHDLFLRDNKDLIQDIRRKNQEASISSIQKAVESLKKAHEGQNQEGREHAMELYEGQLLRKLNKDALSKIDLLEEKVRELTERNQELWKQLMQKDKTENMLISCISGSLKKKGVSFQQLPEALRSQFEMPPLNFDNIADFTEAETTDSSQGSAQNFEDGNLLVNQVGLTKTSSGPKIKYEANSYGDMRSFSQRVYDDDAECYGDLRKAVKVESFPAVDGCDNFPWTNEMGRSNICNFTQDETGNFINYSTNTGDLLDECSYFMSLF